MNSNWSYSPETPNFGQNRLFFSRVTLQFNEWPSKTSGHLFYATSSFVQHFVAIVNSNWSYSPETPNLGQIRQFLKPCDLEIWQMTLQNNRASLLCYFKLCVSFRTHWWIQIGVSVRKRPIWVKFDDFESCATLKFDGWHWKNNRAPLLCYFKICAAFRIHWWIQTGVTVRKRPIWIKFDDF